MSPAREAIRRFAVLVVLVLLSLALGAQTPPVLSNGPNVSGTAQVATAAAAGNSSIENGLLCTTITFEGLANQVPVPKIEGINFNGWLSLIDADAGGSGNFANEPSPQTIMFWLGSNPSIVLDYPASKIEFFYSTSVSLTVQRLTRATTRSPSLRGQPISVAALAIPLALTAAGLHSRSKSPARGLSAST